MNKTVMHIPDISCGHCVAAVDAALRAVPGVADVTVDLESKVATVTAPAPVPRSELDAAVVAAGYTPTSG